MATSKKRCAVYTRKSTEEGLDQDFNSLDAQAEACRAYILSQAGEGWRAIEQAYSDGGISGGHMDRPGLQALIADIEAGKVDVVVVYKVDRLTRSLSDFAKLVDVFDKHDVSFVSVTQSFNTTTSMGRLTLNVLLSFAQFEREVTAERIRDKIAASKKRGQWIGGFVPIGYDNVDTKLVVNPEEARTVRYVMERYVALASVPKLLRELERDGYRTKRRVFRNGRVSGGQPFSSGHLYHFLRNPVYIGKIRHKENVYPGQHEPIIDQDLWNQVQESLKRNAPKRRRSINIKSKSPLTGLIYGTDGKRLTPVHHRKPDGRRYGYYVSVSLVEGKKDDGTKLRLSSKHLESSIFGKVEELLADTAKLMDVTSLNGLTTYDVATLEGYAKSQANRLKAIDKDEKRKAVIDLIERIEINPDQLKIRLRWDGLVPADFQAPDMSGSIELAYPLEMKRRGIETRMIIGGQSVKEPDQSLIKLIATARSWYAGLKDGTYPSPGSIAEIEKVDRSDISRTLMLAFLSPSIIKDIINGRQPEDLTAQKLKRFSGSLPLDWNEQRIFLGMTS